MRTKFLEFGPVNDVYIHKIMGGPKSFAFITYETEAAAKAYVYIHLPEPHHNIISCNVITNSGLLSIYRAREKNVHMQRRKLLIKPADVWHQPDFKDAHQLTLDERVDQNVNNTILMLNDDCLLKILKYLPMQDLLTAEKACWRFRSVAEMIYKTHKVFDSELYPYFSVIALRSLLYNIGPYVQTLRIKFHFTSPRNVQMLRFAALYCANVTDLHLLGIEVSYKTKNIQNLFGKLTKLGIEACSVTDQSLLYLLKAAENKTIRDVNLSSNHELNGKCLSMFNNITVANLYSCSRIEPRHFIAFLQENGTLEDLNIVQCDSMDVACIEGIAKLGALKKLAISNSYSEIAGTSAYSVLTKLKTLRHLQICYLNYGVMDEMLMAFSDEVPLEYLDLSMGHMTKPCLQALLNFKSLRGLTLYRRKDCDDEVLQKIAKLGTFEEFSVASCHAVTNEGVEAVVKLNGQLKHLDVSSCQYLTGELVQSLVAITKDRSQMLTVRVGGSSLNAFDDEPFERTEKKVADNLRLELSSTFSDYPGSSDEASSDDMSSDGWMDYDYWDEYDSDDDDDSDNLSADSEYAGRLFLEILRNGDLGF